MDFYSEEKVGSILTDDSSSNITKKDIVLRGSVIAIIVTIPSLSAFFVAWIISENVYVAAVIGAIVHFIAMGFSFKISKKFFVKTKQ